MVIPLIKLNQEPLIKKFNETDGIKRVNLAENPHISIVMQN
jgi:hypothetical protein